MNDFRAGRCRVLIATDIAARGIDISELPLVINYDLPEVAETYVHRIGRTGRAGHDGTAIAFCSEDERPLLKDIQKLTGLVLDPDSGRLTPGMQTDTKSPRKQESSQRSAPKQAAQGGDGRTPAGQSGDAKGPRRRRRNAPKREGQAQSAHAPQPQNGGGQASENREPGRRRPHRPQTQRPEIRRAASLKRGSVRRPGSVPEKETPKTETGPDNRPFMSSGGVRRKQPSADQKSNNLYRVRTSDIAIGSS